MNPLLLVLVVLGAVSADETPPATTSNEPFSLLSFTPGLEEVTKLFRGEVFKEMAAKVEEAVEEMGAFAGLKKAFEDVETVMDPMSEKMVSVLTDIATAGDELGDAIEAAFGGLAAQLDPVIDSFGGTCSDVQAASESSAESAMNKVMAKQLRENAARRASRALGVNAESGLVVLTFAGAVSADLLAGSEKQSVRAFSIEPSVELGVSVGYNVMDDAFFWGVGAGVGLGVSYNGDSGECTTSTEDDKCDVPYEKCVDETCQAVEAAGLLDDIDEKDRAEYARKKKGFLDYLSVGLTMEVEYFFEPSGFSGFALVFDLDIPDYIRAAFEPPSDTFGVRAIHVIVGHNSWGCLEGDAGQAWDAFWEGSQVVGFGVTIVDLTLTKESVSTPAAVVAKRRLFGSSGISTKIKNVFKAWKEKWTTPVGNKREYFEGLGLTVTEAFTVWDEATRGGGAFETGFGSFECPQASGEVSSAPQTSSGGKKMDTLLGVLLPMATEGEVVAPVCVGDCGADGLPASSYGLGGTVRIGSPEACDGLQAGLWMDELTLAPLGRLLTKEFDSGVQGFMDTALSPLSGLGLKDLSANLTATSTGVELALLGKPNLGGDGGDAFLNVLASRIEDNTRVQLKAGLDFSGVVELEARVGMAPQQLTENLAVSDADGVLGMSLYTGFTYVYTATTGPELAAGVTLPLTVCYEGCSDGGSSRREVTLSGELSLVLSGPKQLVEGVLRFDGWMYKVFGLPFLHVGNLQLGVSLDLQVALPTELQVGAAVCLGEEGVCASKPSSGEGYVEARVYLGMSASLPKNNYFLAMVSKLTIGGVLDVFRPYIGAVDELKAIMPSKLLESGLYPFDPDYEAACGGQGDEYAADPQASLDSGCFARFSFSPEVPVTIPFRDGDLEIPVGLYVSGRLNLLGWEIALQMKVDQLTKSFLVDLEMDEAALYFGGSDPLIRLGKELVTDSKGRKVASGGARLMIDLQGGTTPHALIDVQGAFDIPLMAASGQMTISLDSDEFSFYSTISFFDGAFEATTTVRWDFDMKSLAMSLSDMTFADLVKIREVSFVYDSSNPLARAEWTCKIDVWEFSVAAFMAFAEHQNGFEAEFDFYVDAAIVETRITGRALIDTSDFLKSEFEVEVTVGLGDLGEAVVAAVGAAVEAIGQVAEEAWNAVEGAVTQLWSDIGNAFEGVLSGIANAVEGFLEDMERAIAYLDEALADVPVLGKLVDVGKKLFSGDFEGAAQVVAGAVGLFSKSKGKQVALTPAMYDPYGCQLYRDKWEECWLNVCTDKYSDPYGDPECLAAMALAAAEVERKARVMGIKRGNIDASKAANAGITAIREGAASVPAPPPIGPTTIKVPYGSSGGSASFAGEGTKLGGAGTDGSPQGGAEPVAVQNVLDFSSTAAFEASVGSAKEAMTAALKDKVLEDQEGLSLKMQVEAGYITLDPVKLSVVPSVVVGCDAIPSLSPPIFSSIDSRCTEGAEVVVEELTRSSNGEWCIPSAVAVRWRGTDDPSCGQSISTTQMLFVEPMAPLFDHIPSDVTISIADSTTDWDLVGRATAVARSGCDPSVEVTYVDGPVGVQQASDGGCVTQQFTRVWKAHPKFTEMCSQLAKLTVKHVQVITIVDDVAPTWVTRPEATLHIPFAQNTRATATLVPVTSDASAVVISSTDGPVTTYSDEATCRTTGIASFVRTWTASDICGNTRSWSQTVVIDPPLAGVPIDFQAPPVAGTAYKYAIGVEQMTGSCNPGKQVRLGTRTYYTTPPSSCTDPETGCWVKTESLTGTVEVGVPKPSFSTSVSDITIGNHKSLDTADTGGVPKATGYCGTLAKVTYADGSPTKESCGHWTVKRKFTASPVMTSCGSPPASLSSVQYQMITVKETRAPTFAVPPLLEISVPFFESYHESLGQGKDTIPTVETSAGSEMAALGMAEDLMLHSDDGPIAMQSASGGSCASTGMATFTRTWEAANACGKRRTMSQTVRIHHPVSSGPTIAWSVMRWGLAPGVTQGSSNCKPYKLVKGGRKEYAPQSVKCTSTSDPYHCRYLSDVSTSYTTKVYPTDAYFTTFPRDFLGWSYIGPNPTVYADCGAPVGLSYQDSASKAVAPHSTPGFCLFERTRTWKAHRVYSACTNPFENAAGEERTQTITLVQPGIC